MRQGGPIVLLFLIASGLAYAAGEYFSKKFAQHPSVGGIVVVMAAFALEGLLWLPAIARTNALIMTSVIWSLLAFISTLLIGFFVFKESLSPMAIGGVVLGFVSIMLLCAA